MAERRGQHGSHDPLTVAAAADRAGPSGIARALLAACTDCARLFADLQALALALPATATPTRPRDFTLTAADAERLRPHGLRHRLGLIGSARDTITRPLAIGFTALGLAGLLVATVPGALPSASSAGGDGAPVASDAATLELAVPAAIAGDATPDQAGLLSIDSGGAATQDRSTQAAQPLEPDRPGTSPLGVLSAAFLAVGSGLLVVRRANAPRRIR